MVVSELKRVLCTFDFVCVCVYVSAHEAVCAVVF